MTEADFEDRLRQRIARAAAFSEKPGPLRETTSAPRRRLAPRVKWMIAAAAAAVVVIAGVAIAVQDEDGRVITVDDPPPTAVADPQVDDTVPAEESAVAEWPTILGPETPTPAVPTGWKTLEFGPFRFAVPRDWQVPISRACLERSAPGVVLVSTRAEQTRCGPPQHPLPKSVLTIAPVSNDDTQTHEEAVKVGTLSAHLVDPSDCDGCPDRYRFDNGYDVSVTGDEAPDVLASFTDSGSRRVLQQGPLAKTDGWQQVEFGGYRLLAPSTWKVVDLVATYQEKTTPQGGYISGQLNPGSCSRAMFTASGAPTVFLGESPIAPSCPIGVVMDLRADPGLWIRGAQTDDAEELGDVISRLTVEGLEIAVVDVDRLGSRVATSVLDIAVSDGVSKVWITLGVGFETPTARSILASIESVS